MPLGCFRLEKCAMFLLVLKGLTAWLALMGLAHVGGGENMCGNRGPRGLQGQDVFAGSYTAHFRHSFGSFSFFAFSIPE